MNLVLVFFFREKMSCDQCFRKNAGEFEKVSNVFTSRRPLLVFMLNVILNVEQIWEEYCSCSNTGKQTCLICEFRQVYFNDQFQLYEHCFDFNYLARFHYYLSENLQRLLKETDTHFVCRLINKKFFYKNKNFFNGQTYCYSVEEALVFSEKTFIKSIEKNDFKIIVNDFNK